MDPAASFELAPAGEGRLAARGALSFATARAASESGRRALAGAPGRSLEVDFAGITACDSAGLAVLLEWLGEGRRAGVTLRYVHLPQGLVALARISEIEELLERGV